MRDKCKHGYKDGEYCIQCDKPEYIKSLQSKVAELEGEVRGLENEKKTLMMALAKSSCLISGDCVYDDYCKGCILYGKDFKPDSEGGK